MLQECEFSTSFRRKAPCLLYTSRGHDVRFQSTTRSPILVGDAIASRREFVDNYGDGIPNYLYNLDPRRLPILCYEHPAMPAAQVLAEEIGGLTLVTEPPCRTS